MRKSSNLIVILILIGAFLLLFYNIGFISISLELLWPLLPLAYGLYLFAQFFKTKNKEVLTFATILTGSGILLLINTLFIGLSLQEMIPLWPIIPLLWGVGNLLTYLVDRKDTSLLLTSSILLCGSILLLFSQEPWIQSYLKFWPVILIVGCIVVLIHNSKGKKSSES